MISFYHSLFAFSKIRVAYERMEERRKQGYGPEVSANLCGIELTQAADVSKI